MSTEMKNQLKQCFEVLAKIRAEYPDGEFDREMIHGDMDFRFKRIKKIRDKLEEFPFMVYAFARFKNALRVPDDSVRSVFNTLLKDLKRFSEKTSIFLTGSFLQFLIINGKPSSSTIDPSEN